MTDTPAMLASPVLSIDAVAARYGVSDDTIYRWLRNPSSNFPRPIRLPTSGLRWRVEQLNAWELAEAEAANKAA